MSRWIRLASILAMLCTALPAHPADPDAETIVRRLARPAPATIAFKEIRFSPLLDEPLIVSGELGYSAPTSLDRMVLHPYRELTEIRGESVRVERDGEAPRTFALKRAPELRGLLLAFSALLTGDIDALERQFEVAATGDRSWRLTLTPRNARTRKRPQQLTMTGRGDEPACLSIIGADGAQSVMLLGAKATEAVERSISPEQLNARCAPDSVSQ